MALPNILKDRLSLPAVGAPLFIISHPALVIAQCKAGIVGAFPSLNARPVSQLDEWLHEITEALAEHDRAHPENAAAPFAVNQIVHKSNTRLEQDMALTVKWKAPIVITSLGAREDVNAAVHGYGGITLHDIITNRFAHKAIEKGADGLIAVAAGAGGHAGSLSPFALIQDIRSWFDGPLLLSGAIATGRAILAAQVMGADLAYIGSAFIATPEARDRRLQASDCPRRRFRYRWLDPVHRRLRQLFAPFDRQRRSRSRRVTAQRRQLHEFRLSRRVGRQGVAGYLGKRPGHRRDCIGTARRGTRGPARTRIRRGEETRLRLRRVCGWARGAVKMRSRFSPLFFFSSFSAALSGARRV
jgi:Nitronate monooxygenase